MDEKLDRVLVQGKELELALPRVSRREQHKDVEQQQDMDDQLELGRVCQLELDKVLELRLGMADQQDMVREPINEHTIYDTIQYLNEPFFTLYGTGMCFSTGTG